LAPAPVLCQKDSSRSAECLPTMVGALEAIDKNEEFIRMTLAVIMAPD